MKRIAILIVIFALILTSFAYHSTGENKVKCSHTNKLDDSSKDDLPEDQRTCKENLGECMSWCNEKIRKPSTDCTGDTFCCVLVQ